ncbi:hypothetical protein PR048_016480 [Dryococelus australis]|uniref:Uncharacterized protein n=1 Tax=Dryococelus australis TaxID=614101 RepID=A0ABQ9HJU1_9NEOP|nr:hypothetical protein PR048_016480 [Dryococelus australis]
MALGRHIRNTENARRNAVVLSHRIADIALDVINKPKSDQLNRYVPNGIKVLNCIKDCLKDSKVLHSAGNNIIRILKAMDPEQIVSLSDNNDDGDYDGDVDLRTVSDNNNGCGDYESGVVLRTARNSDDGVVSDNNDDGDYDGDVDLRTVSNCDVGCVDLQTTRNVIKKSASLCTVFSGIDSFIQKCDRVTQLDVHKHYSIANMKWNDYENDSEGEENPDSCRQSSPRSSSLSCYHNPGEDKGHEDGGHFNARDENERNKPQNTNEEKEGRGLYPADSKHTSRDPETGTLNPTLAVLRHRIGACLEKQTQYRNRGSCPTPEVRVI